MDIRDDAIDVTGVDLAELAKAAYRYSKPQGMGMLHYREGELSDEDAAMWVNHFADRTDIALGMDYVHGRACKLTVFRGPNETLYIAPDWFDHSYSDLEALLTDVGLVDRLAA